MIPKTTNADKMSEEIKYDRRRFLRTAAMTIAAAQLGRTDFCGSTIQQGKPGELCRQLSRGRTSLSAH